ncbi:MAG TPA: N-acetylmuramic acid 6-phosphate etherase [Chthoniobacterales bacterium]|jgi:N-acetylmuramic acid 6-phosphate etherase|nr:N-acetylmuramic acid 6-phosphate etherase [Chthoniobacterales bacterium]
MNAGEKILGVEGGGTKTAWVLVERGENDLRVLDQGKLPPANFRLATPDELRVIFRELPKEIQRAGIFLAGCATEEDRQSLTRLCAEVWPAAKSIVGSDRDSGLAAALGHGDGIVVNAGSGSSVTGRRDKRIENAGGWGHILGDVGGGYYLSLQALRLILREYDLHRGEVQFTTAILRALSLNTRDELVRWAQTADKMDVANLAPVVFESAAAGDSRVVEIIEEGARALCDYTEAVATRLHVLAPKVVLLGGLFQRDSIYTHAFRRRLKKTLPDARVTNSERAPEFGAAWLAAEMQSWPEIQIATAPEKIDDLAAALTEQRNPRSENLEKLSAEELVKLFVSEEKAVEEALAGVIVDLARAVQLVADSLGKGGRLFYIGAGTSGRLGVLDASEIPPTFGASPELVQGIIAGGTTALHRSVEGAEDDSNNGAVAIDRRGVKEVDVVVGITASGRTPFVLGGLTRAKSLGAKTILLSCNPAREKTVNVDLAIDLAVGPEILTGSTRLKAGTATKVALNIISTGAMVALGKVRGNLMIDLNTSNAKLRDRATRMVAHLTECDYEAARAELDANGWDLRAVLAKAGK